MPSRNIRLVMMLAEDEHKLVQDLCKVHQMPASALLRMAVFRPDVFRTLLDSRPATAHAASKPEKPQSDKRTPKHRRADHKAEILVGYTRVSDFLNAVAQRLGPPFWYIPPAGQPPGMMVPYLAAIPALKPFVGERERLWSVWETFKESGDMPEPADCECAYELPDAESFAEFLPPETIERAKQSPAVEVPPEPQPKEPEKPARKAFPEHSTEWLRDTADYGERWGAPDDDDVDLGEVIAELAYRHAYGIE